MPVTPRVSVLLPVRDAASTLERVLASLAGQTLRDHEVVVVDDGSTDGSGALLDAWAARDPRVRVVHTPPRGLVPALNHAVGGARGGVLARMDADDVCRAERLEMQWQRLQESPAVDVLGACVHLASDDGSTTDGMQAYVDWQNSLLDHEAIVGDLYVESPLVHPTVALPAAVMRDLGGYREFDGPEDYDLWLRAERAGKRFAKCPEVLLEWWDSPRRLTRVSPRYRAERFFLLKLDALTRRHLAAPRPVVIWGAGPIGKGWCRALQERGHAVRAFVDVDPRKLGQRVHGCPVVAVDAVPAEAGALHLSAVGSAAGRRAVRAAAAVLGLSDGRDLVAVA
jgi:glycosyltransferase involved in cell wall biosynthesis